MTWEFLRNPSWLEVIVGVIALGTPFVIYRLTQRKELSYRVLSDNFIARVVDHEPKRLTIAYDGLPVTAATLALIRIENTGSIPVTPQDFHGPIDVEFRRATRILEAQLSTIPPEVLPEDDESSIDGARFRIRPMLLNPRDAIELSVLRDGPRGDIAVGGRIAGVSAIKQRTTSLTVGAGARWMFVGIIAGTVIGAAVTRSVLPLPLRILGAMTLSTLIFGLVLVATFELGRRQGR